MTREEIISIAAEALLRAGGFDPDRADLGMKPIHGAPSSANAVAASVELHGAIVKAEAVLDAVRLWGLRGTLQVILELHGPDESGEWCRVCDPDKEPLFPCSTFKAATMGLDL